MLRWAEESVIAGDNFFVRWTTNGRVQEENLRVQGEVYVASVSECGIEQLRVFECKVESRGITWWTNLTVNHKHLSICFGMMQCV